MEQLQETQQWFAWKRTDILGNEPHFKNKIFSIYHYFIESIRLTWDISIKAKTGVTCHHHSLEMSSHVKVPLTPKYFLLNINLFTCSKHIATTFPSNKSSYFTGFKTCKNQVSYIHNQFWRGVGLLLISNHNPLCMHVYKELINNHYPSSPNRLLLTQRPWGIIVLVKSN